MTSSSMLFHSQIAKLFERPSYGDSAGKAKYDETARYQANHINKSPSINNVILICQVIYR